jgi:CRISPR-associated endonuclease/helicase Cas3
MIYKARYRTNSDTEYQTLETHLNETAMFVELFSRKIDLHKPALLTALVHDQGKYSKSWQTYLESHHKDGKRDGKEDHGAAGGQFLYKVITRKITAGGSRGSKELIGQMLAACVMYHHGPGLPDVITPNGTAKLYNRLEKKEEETHAEEAEVNLDPSIRAKIEEILSDENFITETLATIGKLTMTEIEEARFFNLGLTARFLSSCLIDADRRSSAFFDRNIPVSREEAAPKIDWNPLRRRLEDHLAGLSTEGKLNEIRRMVSDRCAGYGDREDGIHTLTAATGAGKTLASLRYALVHAERTGKDHIFIIAPYTSILDQNAEIIRRILDPYGENGGIVLEYHSNLDQSERTEHFIDSSETWNVPIIITTMVQFLEALFGFGTRKIRRMHQLANSVLVFDEVQTLPVSCTYPFTWAIRYLRQSANTAVLLCTATQPGLNRLKSEYALPHSRENEIIPDVTAHFRELRRVELIDETRPGGRTLDEIAGFIESLNERSILTVVNTKPQAQKLYAALSQKHPDWFIIHLSTNMCPVHRRKVIAKMKLKLRDKTRKCVCVSTRLIEAGIDIDFDVAIRFLAGFDSIVQTAGRCNRNGNLKDPQGNDVPGKTYIVNIVKEDEHIGSLKELVLGQNIMRRILDEYHDNEAAYDNTLLHPALIERYFDDYYGQLPDELLKYKVFGKHNGRRDDTLIDLLSSNGESVHEYVIFNEGKNDEWADRLTQFRQSFESAWSAFEVIAQDTAGVIVPFKQGRDIISELNGLPDIKRCASLLEKAQRYSVNLYRKGIEKLREEGIVRLIPANNGMMVYELCERYYDRHTGLTREPGEMTLLNV